MCHGTFYPRDDALTYYVGQAGHFAVVGIVLKQQYQRTPKRPSAGVQRRLFFRLLKCFLFKHHCSGAYT